VTEEIWQNLPHQGEALIVADWPEAGARDETIEREMEIIFSAIRFVRNARAEMGLDPARRLDLIAVAAEYAPLLEEQRDTVGTLARADLRVLLGQEAVPAQALHQALPGIELYLPLEGVVDLAAERERIAKELARLDGAVQGIRTRLASPQFTRRAPAHIVQKEQERLTENEQLQRTLQERLEALGA
jgi:valyl-tRNA synthetase